MLKGQILVTVRLAEPRPFLTFAVRAQRPVPPAHPVERALRRRAIETSVRDFSIRLHLLADGEQVAADAANWPMRPGPRRYFSDIHQGRRDSGFGRVRLRVC